MIKYITAIKVGYNEAWFEFEDSKTACEFAENALNHSIKCKDTDKQTEIILRVFEEEEGNEETV